MHYVLLYGTWANRRDVVQSADVGLFGPIIPHNTVSIARYGLQIGVDINNDDVKCVLDFCYIKTTAYARHVCCAGSQPVVDGAREVSTFIGIQKWK